MDTDTATGNPRAMATDMPSTVTLNTVRAMIAVVDMAVMKRKVNPAHTLTETDICRCFDFDVGCRASQSRTRARFGLYRLHPYSGTHRLVGSLFWWDLASV